MPKVEKTLNSELSSAELCRRNGWTPGTWLEAIEYGPDGVVWNHDTIEITAVGRDWILAKGYGDASEDEWDLTCREWDEVKRPLKCDLCGTTEVETVTITTLELCPECYGKVAT